MKMIACRSLPTAYVSSEVNGTVILHYFLTLSEVGDGKAYGKSILNPSSPIKQEFSVLTLDLLSSFLLCCDNSILY